MHFNMTGLNTNPLQGQVWSTLAPTSLAKPERDVNILMTSIAICERFALPQLN